MRLRQMIEGKIYLTFLFFFCYCFFLLFVTAIGIEYDVASAFGASACNTYSLCPVLFITISV